ncbi:unnamed protein product [Clonostachys solani]|uniref:Rhodopsin domain-containing protein n=1 Tax=Clonostachys solani TaxID=160281 RepID=A0A9N9Z0Z0_9HYPO|nr:unnamed protein product [Clonostachys solani]
MFSLGVFGTITSCIQVYYATVLHRIVSLTWDYVQILVRADLEAIVALIMACSPSIGVLLRIASEN